MRRTLIAACLSLTIIPATAPAETGPLERAALSRSLFDLGVEQSDPLMMIVAARMRKGLVSDPVDRAPEDGAEGVAADTADAPHLDWRAMLDAATELSTGNPTLLGLIDDAMVARPKGVRGRPVHSISSIGSGSRAQYAPFTFAGGEAASVYVEGSGGGDLNVLIHDAQGRLVCSDTSSATRHAGCYWRPEADADYRVTVENRGPSATRYSMWTN